jgi:hypothetical protein
MIGGGDGPSESSLGLHHARCVSSIKRPEESTNPSPPITWGVQKNMSEIARGGSCARLGIMPGRPVLWEDELRRGEEAEGDEQS